MSKIPVATIVLGVLAITAMVCATVLAVSDVAADQAWLIASACAMGAGAVFIPRDS
jgi:hypothetical protein